LRGWEKGRAGKRGCITKWGEGYRPLRICARRKSKEEEEQGRERLEKTKKRKGEVSESQEMYNRYIVIATSLEKAVSVGQITELYRMRWEIEQVSKRLKSLFHYNQIPPKILGRQFAIPALPGTPAAITIQSGVSLI
jgi:hypothetical protein